MNIVIIGRRGQLAWELQRSLSSLGRVTAVGRPEVDLAAPDSLRSMIRELRPDVLVNAGAYTAVDQAESEQERAMAINAAAPRVIAEEARRINALLVAYSTDYVFDGAKTCAYTELDAPNPLNVYGASKLAGDRAVEAAGGDYLIFRISWLYSPRGKNFLRTMMRLALERDEVKVVDDQTGAPTPSYEIAQATSQIIGQLSGKGGQLEPLGDRRGIYNMTSQGSVSWYGFAVAIVEEMRHRRMSEKTLAEILPISTREYAAVAARPRNSRLSNQKIHRVFGIALPNWKVSLAAVMDELEIRGGNIVLQGVREATD